MNDLINVFIPAFVTLFVIIDSVGLMPIFAALSRDMEAAHRRVMAIRGSLVATGVLLLFALLGDALLSTFGITLAAFRIAGGLLLFSTAFEMIFEFRAKRRSRTAECATTERPKVADDISVVPLAIPFIAGPGAITTVILLMTERDGNLMHQGVVIAALLSVMAITYVLLELSGWFVRFAGTTMTTVITRLLGIILAALAVQFIIDGVREAVLG
jgi:multiple antibiotic resistance protein